MTSYVARAQNTQIARRSVQRLREAVRAGSVSSMARVDLQTGEVLDPESRALFASLPTLTPATAPDELGSHELITAVPKGLNEVAAQPKYRLDRQVFVRTTVTHDVPSERRPVGAFNPAGKVRFTHRARLRGQRGDNFLVQLEGADRAMPFAKTDVFAWNEPCGVPAAGGTISGVQIDYNDPRFKAHICAGYLEIADDLARLDYTKEPEALQATLVHRLAGMVRMSYPGRGEGHSGARAGSLINGGAGVCFVQRAVAGAFLQAFARVLNFQVQVAVGRTLRRGVPHGFVVVTLFPSMSRYVCDPAWSEPLTDLRVAFFGPRWGQDRRLEGFEGEQTLVVRGADVDLPEVLAKGGA